MTRIAVRCVLAVGLTLLGWTVGRAQGTQRTADFRLDVLAPAGQTIIRCLSGCAVAIVPHVQPPPGVTTPVLPTVPPKDQPITATCSGKSEGCLSLMIDGWLVK
jgi:hypothetical protein